MSEERITLVVPDGRTVWKDGEVEKLIEEKVAKRPVLHMNFDGAMYHMDRVMKCDCRTWELLRIVFTELPEDPLAGGATCVGDAIREYTTGIRHIGGLIDLTLKLAQTHPGIAVNWQYPESHIHPAHQSNLGDLVNTMSQILNPGQPEEEP